MSRAAHPEVPWRRVIATRHRLVHGYDDVDVEMLWRIVAVNVPALRRQVVDVLATYRSD